MNRVAVSAFCGLTILLGGCSTVVKGTSQQVSIATPGVENAMCELSSPAIGFQTVQAPANVTLVKSKHNVAVRCYAQCYEDGVGTIASELEPMTAGNVLVGGVIGLGIDAATGAMNKYQPSVSIAMSRLPKCNRRAPRNEIPMANRAPAPQG